MKVELTQEWCMNMAKIEESADDAATMCVWCEQRVQGACKSHYDTLTCTHRVIVPTAEEWGSAVEARAAELHEGCQMPMEQARALAASEAGPDWYARGQDWGLADALTNGQSGDWVLDDIARAFAAGAAVAYAHGAAVVDKCNGYIVDNARLSEQLDVFKCRCVALEEQADLTAIHLARMQSALQDSGSRSADYLRKAIKAEAEVASLRAAALGSGNVIELKYALYRLADAAEALGVNHFGEDWRSDEVQELQAATHAARLVLGPNALHNRATPERGNHE